MTYFSSAIYHRMVYVYENRHDLIDGFFGHWYYFSIELLSVFLQYNAAFKQFYLVIRFGSTKDHAHIFFLVLECSIKLFRSIRVHFIRWNSLGPAHLGYSLLCPTFSSFWQHQHWSMMKIMKMFTCEWDNLTRLILETVC